MPTMLTEARRYCSSSILFCSALAVCGAFYGISILAAWAQKIESELVVMCIPDKSPGANLERTVGELKKDPIIREARIVEPSEVMSWVAQAVQEVGTSATLRSSAQLPGAIELKCRGPVTDSRRFRETLRALRNNPACGRVFFDSSGQKRAAAFYYAASRILRLYLLIAVVGAVAGGLGMGWGRTHQMAEAMQFVGPKPGGGAAASAGRAKDGAFLILRGVVPVLAAWLCLLTLLLVWPVPVSQGLSVAMHALVLVATFVSSEAAYWCGAAVGHHLA